MKIHNKIFVSMLVIGLLILSASQVGVIAGNHGDLGDQGGSDNFQIDTGNVTVNVAGGQNVPMYTFWDSNDNSTVYRVQFKQIFEFYDNDTANGAYDADNNETRVAGPPYALASLSWDFSNVTSEDGATHFNITSSDGLFTFANHIEEGANALKFDVIIDESFEFKSNDSHLALAFSLTNANSTDSDVEQDGDTVNFDDAFFQVEETAEDDEGTVDVGLSSSTDGNETIAYMSYGQFTGQLVHDPTVGVQTSSLDADDTEDEQTGPALASDEIEISWDFDISKEAAGATMLIASVIALLVPVTIYRSRKN